jgi:AcrR family transcriptional regulator
MPKAFSEHEKETIRAQMREKGKKLFEKQGLRKTSVDELTQAVGISKGAFYLFFQSKEELFLQILEQIEKEVQTSILEFVIKPGAHARKNVSEILKGFLHTWDAYPLLKDFSRTDFDYLVRKVPPERVMQHANSDEDFTNDLIARIKREGIKVKAQPHIVSNLFKSLFFINLHREDMGKDAYTETMDVMIELIAGYVVGE